MPVRKPLSQYLPQANPFLLENKILKRKIKKTAPMTAAQKAAGQKALAERMSRDRMKEKKRLAALTRGAAPKTVQGGTARAFSRSRSKSPAGEPNAMMREAMGFGPTRPVAKGRRKRGK